MDNPSAGASVGIDTVAAAGAANGTQITFYSGSGVPLELHKVRVVQKLYLLPIEQRLRAIRAAGYNSFLLNTTKLLRTL